MKIAKTYLSLSTLLALLHSTGALACATCGCSLSSDGALGYANASGWSIGLDESYIDQNQLRSGTHAVTQRQVQSVPGQELEQLTVNRFTTVGIGYAASADWNFKLSIPYIDRSHSTYGSDSTAPLTADQLSSATASGLGDIKVIASYQGWLPSKNLGLQFGIKLPTGNFGGTGPDNATGQVGQGAVGHHPAVFGPNGNVGSQYLDTSLNVGNGSTDLIIGGYYFQPVSQDFDAFINGQFEFSVKQQLDQNGANYRPGSQTTLSAGLRYEADPKIVPQLQLNLIHKDADVGALADTSNTAGTILYLSPGITANIATNTWLYAFVQIPVASNLSGYQLFPRYTASLGMSYHF